jgi:hypothetical protein
MMRAGLAGWPSISVGVHVVGLATASSVVAPAAEPSASARGAGAVEPPRPSHPRPRE